MSKPIVLLADLDDKYIASLELKFIEELYDKIDFEVITDKEYFNEYFSLPRTIEILVISEELYNTEIQKHNISNVFVLSENTFVGGTEDLSVTRIFKYTSTKEIYNQIKFKSNSYFFQEDLESKETQIIIVYSPIGGAGKTTVAMGVGACLAQNNKNVLYIDAEYIQNFQYFLSKKMTIENDAYREMRSEDEKIYFKLKKYIRHELFDFLPPFCAELSSLNIKYNMYINLIKMAKESKDYDYIIVDMDSVFNAEKADLFGVADKVLILVKQDKCSAFKMEMFLNNINCKDGEKYNFICNAYKNIEKNCIIDNNNKSNFFVDEYINFIDNATELSIDMMVKNDEFQKLAYMLF